MNTLGLIAASIAVYLVVGVIRAYFRMQRKKQMLANLREQMGDQLLQKMRRVSLENQLATTVQFRLALKDESDEEHVLEQQVPANEGGSIPFFAPGILEVTYDEQTVAADITDIEKEYYFIVDAEGKLQHRITEAKP